jgi:hypothetical protein
MLELVSYVLEAHNNNINFDLLFNLLFANSM